MVLKMRLTCTIVGRTPGAEGFAMQKVTNSRFAALFGQLPERDIWDNVLLRLGQFAVAPTRGSIIPFWLLVVPEMEAINFAQLVHLGEPKPSSLLSRVSTDLSKVPTDLIWFEHGADVPGSVVGCGVDHAHLHLLLSPGFSLEEFAAAAFEASGREWTRQNAHSAYDTLDPHSSYYIFGNLETAFVVCHANFGSQFFRRLVAQIAGRPEEWDYKLYGGEDKVRETLAAFSPQAAAA